MNHATIRIALVAGALGAVSALLVPSLATGNARRVDGTLAALSAAQTPFLVALSGDEAVPGPGSEDSSGMAAITFDRVDVVPSEVCFDVDLPEDLAATAAHIHKGAAGVAGPVVVNFGTPSGIGFVGCVEAETTVVDAIKTTPGEYYLNVHNVEFPAGAVRGQLLLGGEPPAAIRLLPSPLRAYDSRDTTPLDARETREVNLRYGLDGGGASVIAVPPGAIGAIVTLTATETQGPGFLTLHGGPEVPSTSNINFGAAGVNIAVSTQTGVDERGRLSVTAGPAGSHFIIDVVGYLY